MEIDWQNMYRAESPQNWIKCGIHRKCLVYFANYTFLHWRVYNTKNTYLFYSAIMACGMKHASTYHCCIELLQRILLVRRRSLAGFSEAGCNIAYIPEILLKGLWWVIPSRYRSTLVPIAGISGRVYNCIPQNTVHVGCSYSPLPEIPGFGTKVLIS